MISNYFTNYTSFELEPSKYELNINLAPQNDILRIATNSLPSTEQPSTNPIWNRIINTRRYVQQHPNLTTSLSVNLSDLDNAVQEYLNIPYLFGGKDKNGIDCSGFTSAVMRKMGYDVNGASYQQYENTDRVDSNNMRSGDLIFLKDTIPGRERGKASHVAIILSVNSDGTINVYEASGGKTQLRKWNLNRDYYKQHLLGIGRPRKK